MGSEGQTAGDRPQYPPGLNNAFLFGTFNALSFQIVLGSPMVLYAKALGASATVLGIITGMMPLLVISQIPAANYIGRVGFKKFNCVTSNNRRHYLANASLEFSIISYRTAYRDFASKMRMNTAANQLSGINQQPS